MLAVGSLLVPVPVGLRARDVAAFMNDTVLRYVIHALSNLLKRDAFIKNGHRTGIRDKVRLVVKLERKPPIW